MRRTIFFACLMVALFFVQGAYAQFRVNIGVGFPFYYGPYGGYGRVMLAPPPVIVVAPTPIYNDSTNMQQNVPPPIVLQPQVGIQAPLPVVVYGGAYYGYPNVGGYYAPRGYFYGRPHYGYGRRR